MEADGGEALVEASDDVEDEGVVSDVFAEVAEVLGHPLVAAAILGDGEISLLEGSKLLVGVEGAGGTIPEKLGLDGEPGDTGSGTALGDGVGEIVGDGAEEPGVDDSIHAHLVQGGGRDVVGEDVALQGELPDGEEERLAPPGVEGGGDVEEQRHEGADVLHGDGLSVQVQESRGLMLKKGCVEGGKIAGVGGGVLVAGGLRGRALTGSAVEGVAKASIGRVALGLSKGGLALCFRRAGESGVAVGLGRALAVLLCSSSLLIALEGSSVGGGILRGGGIAWQRRVGHGAAPEEMARWVRKRSRAEEILRFIETPPIKDLLVSL
ncbi:uncharacterized protein LOC133926962 [Phragmites australis]|uniref:uncharacterized protein LOC133926962 n=1 Tax=Phragmites australis TaxID=29695 RepID=UPI002D798E8D|nr:uncharacterized protein LOC133926962 [Phragmites australis]